MLSMVAVNKLGIIASVIGTIIAVGLALSITTTPDSISNQGQKVIEKTTKEILQSPQQVKDLTEKSIDTVKDIPDDVPDTFSEAADQIEGIAPDLPPIVEKTLNDEMLIAKVSIQPGASVPDCNSALNCLSPYFVTIYKDGMVIWTNNDMATHNLISGNPDDGPDGLFDSGLIAPGKSFTQVFGIDGEYEYFCVLHPWVQGKVFVEEA